MNKIVHLPSRISMVPKSVPADAQMERVSATVHDIVKPQGTFHIYEERYSPKDVAAREFFAALWEVKSASIVNKEDSVTRESVLRVEKKTGGRYELKVSAFVRLTESVPGAVSDAEIERYVTTTLDADDLQIGMLTEAEDTFTDSVMTPEEAREFRIDAEDALFGDGYYACSISSLGGSGRSFTLDDFTLQDIRLLTLLVHAYEAYFGEECIVDDEDIKIELSRCEGMHTHTTLIPFGLFQGLILEAISRKHPLYDNYPTDKRIKRFHGDHIAGILSEEYLNGEFEDE